LTIPIDEDAKLRVDEIKKEYQNKYSENYAMNVGYTEMVARAPIPEVIPNPIPEQQKKIYVAPVVYNPENLKKVIDATNKYVSNPVDTNNKKA
jgi:hypothetical protein